MFGSEKYKIYPFKDYDLSTAIYFTNLHYLDSPIGIFFK